MTAALRPDRTAVLLCPSGAGKSSLVNSVLGDEVLAVGKVRDAVGSRARIVHVPAAVVPPMSMLLGRVLSDVLLTREELRAMMDGLADTSGPAGGEVVLSDWLDAHGDELGREYANELSLHF